MLSRLLRATVAIAAASGMLLTVTALLVALAPSAQAHGRGSDATNYRSTITDTPDLPGVSWRVYGGDELLEVTNTSDTELLVYGYQQSDEGLEPYLRVGPEGVFENRNAAATYQNADRYAEVTIPDDADIGGSPDWQRVADGPSFAWHDHRMHWMSPQLHPAVTDQSVRTVLYEEWTVPLLLGAADHAVTGRLEWIPGPSPLPWLAAGLIATLPALAGLRSRSQHDRSWHRLVRPAAVVLGVVVLLNLTHLADDLFATPVDVPTRALAAGQTAMFLAIGAFGALRAWQSGDGAFTALGVGSGAVLVGQGLLYALVLGASQNASLFPDILSRFTVAASIMQALCVGAVAVIGTRALLPPAEESAATEPARA